VRIGSNKLPPLATTADLVVENEQLEDDEESDLGGILVWAVDLVNLVGDPFGILLGEVLCCVLQSDSTGWNPLSNKFDSRTVMAYICNKIVNKQ